MAVYIYDTYDASYTGKAMVVHRRRHGLYTGKAAVIHRRRLKMIMILFFNNILRRPASLQHNMH